MTRVRMDLFTSLDGCTPADPTPENPMGADWGRLTASFAATRTFRAQHGDPGGQGTTGVDDRYAAAFSEGVGAEIMGAGMFGLHAFPDDPDWAGWWGGEPPFNTPVYVLTHTAPRAPLPMQRTTFHFRNDSIENVLAEAAEAADGADVRIGGGYSTARDYLRAGLVDDVHLMVAPIFLGRGNRWWDDFVGMEFTHRISTEVAESGQIHVTLTRQATS